MIVCSVKSARAVFLLKRFMNRTRCSRLMISIRRPLPRIHQDTLLDVEEKDHALMGSVISVANQLAKEKGIDKSGFRLVVNCGAGAGQSVFHIHFHLLGGRAMNWPPG